MLKRVLEYPVLFVMALCLYVYDHRKELKPLWREVKKAFVRALTAYATQQAFDALVAWLF